MKRMCLAVATTLAAICVNGPAWAGQIDTETIHKAVPFQPGGTVKIHNFSGKVTVTGTNGSEVVVDALRRAPKDRLAHIKLDVAASGSTVTIEANRKDSSWSWHENSVVETDLEIQVPRSASLDIDVFSSPVTITNVDGAHSLKAFSAALTLDQVRGRVRAKTFSGDVEVRCAPDAARPDFDIHTFSGDIALKVPSSASADLDFDSFSGDLNSDVPLSLLSKRGHDIRAKLNPEGAAGAPTAVRLKTFSGDVRIRQ